MLTLSRQRGLLRFDGRLSRIGFWRAYLFLLVASSLVWCLGLFAVMAIGRLGAVLLAPMLPMLAANVAIIVRRLHDRGRSGWWAVPFFILPFLAGLGMSAETAGSSAPALLALTVLGSAGLAIWGWIEIGFLRGSEGPNRYGADPYGVQA